MALITDAPDLGLKTYSGLCACNAFRYTVKFPEISTVYECDCSICVRKGYKWLFPGEGCFEITKDEGKMKVYEFAEKTTAHHFCSVCGTGVFAMKHTAPPGRERGVNVRTLSEKEIDILSIPVTVFNGLAIQPSYQPSLKSPLVPSATETLFTGSCHCQDTRLSFLNSTPLPTLVDLDVTSCTCTKCLKTAPLLLNLPAKKVDITSLGAYTTYTTNNELNFFCNTCGVCTAVEDTSKDAPEPRIKLNLRCFAEVMKMEQLIVKMV